MYWKKRKCVWKIDQKTGTRILFYSLVSLFHDDVRSWAWRFPYVAWWMANIRSKQQKHSFVFVPWVFSTESLHRLYWRRAFFLLCNQITSSFHVRQKLLLIFLNFLAQQSNVTHSLLIRTCASGSFLFFFRQWHRQDVELYRESIF